MPLKVLITVALFALMVGHGSAENPTVKYEDPEIYRVDFGAYPTYKATRLVNPPNEPDWVPAIDPDDSWVVQYKVGNFYLIFSRSYHLRTCRLGSNHGRGSGFSYLGGQCIADYFNHIWITPDGVAVGDMLQIKNSSRVLFRGDRMRVMHPNHRFDGEWGHQPLFKQTGSF